MYSEKTICYNIKASWHTIARMYSSHGADQNVPLNIGYILLNLSKTTGIPSTQIGPQLGMESTSLTRILKSMEEKGLITKKPSEEDKRQVNIFLTDEGDKKKKMAWQTVKNFNQILESEISKEDLTIFQSVLKQITFITENNFKKA